MLKTLSLIAWMVASGFAYHVTPRQGINVDSSSASTANSPQASTGVNSSTSATSSSAASTPTAKYSYLDCYTEGINARALGSASLVNYTSMTVESCASFCLPTYKIFGLEYGGECWCGDTFGTGAVVAPATDCNMPCGGNHAEICGSGNRLSVYSTTPVVVAPVHAPAVNNYTWTGCFTEGNGTRALTSGTNINYSGMTVQSCAAFCYPNPVFGVEYGGECYCGNFGELNASGAQKAPTTDCNTLCPGNASEYCGSGNRLDLYQLPLNVSMES